MGLSGRLFVVLALYLTKCLVTHFIRPCFILDVVAKRKFRGPAEIESTFSGLSFALNGELS
jgi:hypothetical protein